MFLGGTMKKTFFSIFMTVGLFIFIPGIAQADSYMITASDFIPGQPDDSGLDCYIGWHLYNHSGATYRHFFAPVHLPDGAQITSVVVYYEDDSTGYISVELERRNMYSLTVQEMADWDTTGDTAGLRNHKISPILYWTINNEGYVYFLYLYFSDGSAGSDLTIYGIKLNYNAP
jgi:hypothetical protein